MTRILDWHHMCLPWQLHSNGSKYLLFQCQLTFVSFAVYTNKQNVFLIKERPERNIRLPSVNDIMKYQHSLSTNIKISHSMAVRAVDHRLKRLLCLFPSIYDISQHIRPPPKVDLKVMEILYYKNKFLITPYLEHYILYTGKYRNND